MKTNNKYSVDLLDKSIPYGMSRRSFIRRLGGGVVIAVALSDFEILEASVTQEYPGDLNAYLKIGTDGRVSCYTGKIEMGQGINTSLAQMLAEELDVPLASVDMFMGDTDLCPYDRGTWGSLTTRFFGPPLRAAGAEARAILLQMASEKLGTPVSGLNVADGVVFAVNDKTKKVSYTELAKGAKIMKTLQEKPPLKDPKDFKIIGKPVSRMDGTEKVMGTAIYAGDMRLPGMVFAKILRPPSHASKLIKADVSALTGVGEITLINQDGIVAVLHQDPETAEKYLSQIKAEYETPPTELNEKTIFEHLIKSAPEGTMVAEGGNLSDGATQAEVAVDSEFLDGYVAHAPIEPHTALAVMENGKLKVWASTQNPFGLKSSIAESLGLKEENVQVLQVFIGGGFGGKSSNGQAMEAAKLAKISGKPVMVAWTRREEFFYDAFRPAAVIKIKSGCKKSGQITLWDYGVYFAGQRGAEHFYDIPNHKSVAYNAGWTAPTVHPFATGAWRAPGNNTNTFARESQINIMAAQIGMDPVEFRLKNLKDERMIRTLKAAAAKFGWTSIKSPGGKGLGVACGVDAGTYVAMMAKVKVDKKTGNVKVERVVVAQDMGLVINPLGATMQAEGCVTMGLGYALTEDVQFTGGEVHNRNFDSYKLPRFSWVPKIEIELLNLPNEPAQGGGEPAIICMGALMANAIYDAIGVRLYQLPMSPERILEALKK
ncbi:MAG: molybdopterin cofactor-binding domain-containing protein [Cyclobacteriaceae bacterium]|nr:molybdopterin cofactor-binding domain-containing protein [Cyclobacteriaceae bacterium]